MKAEERARFIFEKTQTLEALARIEQHKRRDALFAGADDREYERLQIRLAMLGAMRDKIREIGDA